MPLEHRPISASCVFRYYGHGIGWCNRPLRITLETKDEYHEKVHIRTSFLLRLNCRPRSYTAGSSHFTERSEGELHLPATAKQK